MNSHEEDLKILAETVWGELHQPLFPAAQAAADDLVEHHGDCVVAVLFYGSCLRGGDDDEKILDFYVLVDDLAAANKSKILGFLNNLLPPNVFYREISFDERTIRSKYAVMSLDGFSRSMRPGRLTTSIWARFAQPSALAFCADGETEKRITESLVRAIVTATGEVAPTYEWNFTGDELWSRAFELTYRAELRSENATSKGREVFQEYGERYRRITGPALRVSGLEMQRGDGGRYAHHYGRGRVWLWRVRKVTGKVVSFLRLVKGSFTFTGGIDYLAWKIRRHSGVEIEVSPWQRRHPILGGLSLFYKTRRLGGFR